MEHPSPEHPMQSIRLQLQSKIKLLRWPAVENLFWVPTVSFWQAPLCPRLLSLQLSHRSGRIWPIYMRIWPMCVTNMCRSRITWRGKRHKRKKKPQRPVKDLEFSLWAGFMRSNRNASCPVSFAFDFFPDHILLQRVSAETELLLFLHVMVLWH